MKIIKQPNCLIGKSFRFCDIFFYEIDSIDKTEEFYNLIHSSTGQLVKISIKEFERRLSNGSIKMI